MRTQRGVMRGAATPGRTILTAFAIAITVGTGILMLPVMANEPTSLVEALFTATSAISTTGLALVDTETHWTVAGQSAIMVLAKLGGLGIMTMSTLVVLLFGSRMGLGTLLAVKTENNVISTRDLRSLVKRIALFSLTIETIVTAVLLARYMLVHDYAFGDAIFHSVFHSIMSFNSAGFSLYSDGLTRFAGDAVVLSMTSFGAILGGLGFPVVFDLRRNWRSPRNWTLLTRVTLGVTVPLFLIPTIMFTMIEANNPETFGPFRGGQLLALAFFTAVMPRSAGLNAFDIGGMYPESLLLTNVLMFIGAGSASTGGGIRVTTFAVLIFMVWAELRGRTDVEIGRRRISPANQRQAIAIVSLSIALIIFSAGAIMASTHIHLEPVLFEVISAFGTVGLSMGITSQLPPVAHVVLSFLMFAGRLGPLTLGAAIALRTQKSLRTLPEERITIG